jgi:hypothetical protein
MTQELRAAGALGGAFVALLAIGLPLMILLALDPASQAACAGTPTGPGPSSFPGIPSNLLPIFDGASQQFALGSDGWAYLAALNNAESTFATNNGPRTGVLSGSNSAGGAAQQPRRDWGGERVGRGRLSSPVRRPSCRSPEACPERTSSIPLAEPCRFREQACRRRWNWPESPAR